METKIKADAQPTAEQVEALRRFASANGRTWKSCLNHAWMTGRYVEHGAAEYSHLLQQVRNQFGPSWLVRFRLSGNNAACSDCGSTGHNTGSSTCPGPDEQDRLEDLNA